MADFCLKCFNKINGSNYSEFDVIQELGICEECGEYKDVVIDLRGYGLLSSVFWFGNFVSRKALVFYDKFLMEKVNRIRFRYTREQRQAIDGKIPMTEELFWDCVDVCYSRMDNIQLKRLMKTFPQYMRKFCDDYERERRENPELSTKEEQEWQELRQRLIDELGEEYVREHFTSKDMEESRL